MQAAQPDQSTPHASDCRCKACHVFSASAQTRLSAAVNGSDSPATAPRTSGADGSGGNAAGQKGGHRRKRRRTRGRGKRGASKKTHATDELGHAPCPDSAAEGVLPGSGTAKASATPTPAAAAHGAPSQPPCKPSRYAQVFELLQGGATFAANSDAFEQWSEEEEDMEEDPMSGIPGLLTMPSDDSLVAPAPAGAHPLLSMQPPLAATVCHPGTPPSTTSSSHQGGTGCQAEALAGSAPLVQAGPATPARQRSVSCDSSTGAEPGEFASMSRQELIREIRSLRKTNAHLLQNLHASDVETSALRKAADARALGGTKRHRSDSNSSL